MPQQANSTKNGNEKTAFITPTDDDDRNHTNKTNRYKYMSVGAILVVGIVATGTSSSWVPSSLLHHGDTNEDTAKVLATHVEDNLIEEGCVGLCTTCAGPGHGNCCDNLTCCSYLFIPFVGECVAHGTCSGKAFYGC